MKIRALPPAAAPLAARDLSHAARAMFRRERAVSELERDLRQALNASYVRLVSSGRAALTITLRALNRLTGRRQVIIPAYTCYSVPAAVKRAGFEVVLCDVDPATLDFDYRELQQLLDVTEPLCVVSTHLFGFVADLARTRALCGPRGVYVIDDAAQAFGVSTADGALGTLGDVGFYSFGRGKTVTSVEGGAIVTDSPEIAGELEKEVGTLCAPGLGDELVTLAKAAVIWIFLRPSLYWVPAALPFLGLGKTVYSTRFSMMRFSGCQAGLLKRWRHRLSESTDSRTRCRKRWEAVIANIGEVTFASARLPILCASRATRDRLYDQSKRLRLGFSQMYPKALNEVDELASSLDGRRFPGAARIADCLLTIPVHGFVSEDDARTAGRLIADARLQWIVR